MEIKETAVAGTLESSDIQIMVSKGTNGIAIDLQSDVEKQFGNQIRSVITETLNKLGVTDAKVKAVDKGALDCVVKARYIHQLGFDGKSLVNPRQIPMVNEVYEPTEKEILNAKNVINAIEEARIKGSGVISMNGQMVDRPVVLRAQRVMRLAKASNLVDEEGNYLEK